MRRRLAVMLGIVALCLGVALPAHADDEYTIIKSGYFGDAGPALSTSSVPLNTCVAGGYYEIAVYQSLVASRAYATVTCNFGVLGSLANATIAHLIGTAEGTPLVGFSTSDEKQKGCPNYLPSGGSDNLTCQTDFTSWLAANYVATGRPCFVYGVVGEGMVFRAVAINSPLASLNNSADDGPHYYTVCA